jgi:uncharacterized protein YoxC
VTGWPVVVIAVATSVMALAVLVLLVGMTAALRQLGALSRQMTGVLEAMQRDATPTIETVRRTAEEAGRVAVVIREEVQGLSGTSREIRERVERTAARLEERFIEFDTLLDVLQEELEETVLDVAALLRTTRRGAGLLRGVRRVLGGRR